MNFTTYDIILLAIFIVFTSVFLYRHRKNLKKEGLLLLYRTSRGIKIINRIGDKYKKLLNVLSYVSIGLGFVLMLSMLYFFGRIVWIYIFQSQLVQLIKIPPVVPLIPYLPQIFKLSFLPPFYFIYWIIIIAIVAITHEFSHGIFAVNKKIRVKSTGFGFFPFFLPIFLAAFVELDEKRMARKKISAQMAVLSAGTFANVLSAILFFGILVLFFSLSFAPAGVVFDTYTYSAVSIASITSVNSINVSNTTLSQLIALTNGSALSEIKANNETYWVTENFLQSQENSQYVLLYDDAPAVKTNLSNTVIKINEISIKNREQLGKELMKYRPGESVTITTLEDDSYRDYKIILGKNPENKSIPYLGIGFLDRQNSGLLAKLVNAISSFRDSNVYYKPNFEAAEFIYNLLWWLVLICFSVALVNMLPVGIFDGGRFFYLAMLAITKSEKKAMNIFKAVTFLFLLLLLVTMIFWAINMF
jgi:membrane-associated protease RseP (regulator of RpoE activity)